MNKSSNSHGFSLVEALLVLLALTTVAIAGYFVTLHIVHKQKPATNITSTSSSIPNYVGTTNFTGIYGTVNTTRCPNVQRNNPCPLTPLNNMHIAATGTTSNIAEATTTDLSGSFHLEISPGSYSINASSDHSGYPVCVTNTVIVKNGRASRSDIFCDSGIR